MDAVRAVNKAAFGTSAEANLVSALPKQVTPVVSLVAEDDGAIIGHIMFSPVVILEHPGLKIMGLAPVAVVPEHQHRGVGSSLVRAGLEACKRLGFGAVVVVGHPKYYPRFGFLPASGVGIGCDYEVPEDTFMILELRPGYLQGRSGTARYHAAFDKV